MGYYRAGFDPVGVDIKPQPHYPFEFVQADALTFLDELTWLELLQFEAIHASPPCQRWADGFVSARSVHPDLIAPLRPRLEQTGLPFVIENVPRAPLRDAVLICGGGLGCVAGDLQLHRHRRFESNVPLMGVACTRQRTQTVSVCGHGSPKGNRGTLGRHPRIAEKRAAMGIEWMNRDELAEAIPPVYTEWIGTQLLAFRSRAAQRARTGERLTL